MKLICHSCRFWDAKEWDRASEVRWIENECHRHSPVVTEKTGYAATFRNLWPVTRADDFCGDWLGTEAAISD